MTLREALKQCDLDKVFKIITNTICDKKDEAQVEVIKGVFSPVVKRLLRKPKVRRYKYSLIIHSERDLEGNKYTTASFLNLRYVKPPKGYKPWGGNKGIPPKHYNCNLNKYNRIFAIGWTSWGKLIDTPIVNETKLDLDHQVAHILMEITYYGVTEKEIKKDEKEFKRRVQKSLKEIKENKCCTFKSKKKDGYKVVLPFNVMESIEKLEESMEKDVPSQPTNRCNTCWGYGLHALGDSCPMGPMDASDGMPTIKCPECGANANPYNKT